MAPLSITIITIKGPEQYPESSLVQNVPNICGKIEKEVKSVGVSIMSQRNSRRLGEERSDESLVSSGIGKQKNVGEKKDKPASQLSDCGKDEFPHAR